MICHNFIISIVIQLNLLYANIKFLSKKRHVSAHLTVEERHKISTHTCVSSERHGIWNEVEVPQRVTLFIIKMLEDVGLEILLGNRVVEGHFAHGTLFDGRIGRGTRICNIEFLSCFIYSHKYIRLSNRIFVQLFCLKNGKK